MKIFIAVFFVMFSTFSFGSEILNCHQTADSNITYESNGKFKAKASTKEDKKYKITFVINEKDGLLKGNAGNGIKLFKANKDTFLENTGINIILWKVVRSPDKKGKTYLIQAKAYDSFGPVSYTTMWSCN